MANYAKHYLTHNNKFFRPGDRIDDLTDAEWKQLMADDAIESEYDPGEVVAAEIETMLGGESKREGESAQGEGCGDAEGDAEPEADADANADAGEDADADEDVSLADADMPDVSGADSVVEQAPAAPKPRGRAKKEAQGDVG